MRKAILLGAQAILLGTLAYTQTCAAQTPEDCSKGPIPDQVLELKIGKDKVPAPAFVSVRLESTMTEGEDADKKTFESYGLALRDKDSVFPDTEIDVTVMVAKGQRLDGKTFRKLATTKMGAQPSVEEGTPEVQGWSVKDEKRKLDLSHVGYLASLRVEFDPRRGAVLPGRIHLCIPGGQTEKMFGGKLAEPISLVGRFEAKLTD